jgi:hypothetical protein
VLLPIPELAPVMRMVLPSRRLATAFDIFLCVAWSVRVVFGVRSADTEGVGLRRKEDEDRRRWQSFIRVN